MKACWPLRVTRELQVTTTMRNTTHELELLKSKKLTTPNAGEDVDMLLGKQNGAATWGSQFGSFSAKLSIVLPNSPAVVLLGTYPNEMKTYTHTRNRTQMSRAV